jgi:DNA-binding XRE family transcriptional regulator
MSDPSPACLTCAHWKKNNRDGVVGLCTNPPESFHNLPEYRFQYEGCQRYEFGTNRTPYRDRAHVTGICADLRNARIAMGLKQSDAASWLRVNENYISLWERGKAKPTPENVKRITKFIALVNLPLFTE